MQGGMSMPMSMAMAGVNGANPQAMAAMGMNGMAAMNAYGVPPQQQMMMMNMNQMNMNSMAMKMNPNGMNPAAVAGAAPAAAAAGMQQVAGAQAGADWRIQLTREHRANLIAKMYVQQMEELA
ncbi:unnamed protein product [Phytophthora lilii]|uniref:Unnamed protein product n=1 Tax=Phytophthora lilii TaxID=2077276 RepID=A0A9W6TFY5_9STRA|nr:unnamed protein product [Phytophthora lilii]